LGQALESALSSRAKDRNLENRIEPNPENQEICDELYDRWLRIYRKFSEMVETEDAIDLTNAFLKRD
jgi:sugar (pentulose or hexulose) kinase